MVHGSPEGRAPYCFGVSVIDSIERARLYQPGSHPGEWTPVTAAFEIRDLYEPDGGLMELSPRDVGLDSELAVEYLLAFVAYFAALPRVEQERLLGMDPWPHPIMDPVPPAVPPTLPQPPSSPPAVAPAASETIDLSELPDSPPATLNLKDICINCGGPTRDSAGALDNILVCDGCSALYHLSCSSLDGVYETVDGLGDDTPWYCENCIACRMIDE